MGKAPKGAIVVSEERNDEAGKRLREMKKESKFSEFIAIMKKREQESVQPLSSDYEVIENIDAKELKAMGDAGRMVGYDPKTKTAMVLKLAFLSKKKEKENKDGK